MGQSHHAQGQKGNPASTRQANLKKIAGRAHSWRLSQIQHRDREQASSELHAERLAHHGLGRRERRRIEARCPRPDPGGLPRVGRGQQALISQLGPFITPFNKRGKCLR